MIGNFPHQVIGRILRVRVSNLSRLQIAWENIQTSLGALNSTFLTALQSAISSAHSNGIDVLVDLHNYAHYVNASHWGTGSPSYVPGGNQGTTATGVNVLVMEL